MFKPSPILSARLRLTTKQVNGGYYKGNRTGSMGAHTEYGQYIIDYRKTRHYNMPDLSKCELTPFVTKEMEPTKWEKSRPDGTTFEPPKVDGMDLLKSWHNLAREEYDWWVEQEEPDRQAKTAQEQQNASGIELQEQILAKEPHPVATRGAAIHYREDVFHCLFRDADDVLGNTLNDFWRVAENLNTARGINWLTTDTMIDGPNERLISAFRRTLIANGDRFRRGDLDLSPGQGFPYFSAVVQSISGRKLFIIEEGNMGLGPYDIREVDHVWILPGVVVPLRAEK